MGLEFLASAGKHGFSEDDAVWAMANARHTVREFDEPRVPGRLRPTLFIGPSKTPHAPLIEVLVEVVEPDRVVVFHVMEARQKTRQRLETMTEDE